MPALVIEGRIWPEIAIMVLALAWDVTLGEPKRFHPVSWMGSSIGLLEKRAPRQGNVVSFLYGLGMAILVPGISAAAVYFLSRGLQYLSDIAYIAVGIYLMKGCFAGKELDRAALRVGSELEANRMEEARKGLSSLVSRDTAGLSPE